MPMLIEGKAQGRKQHLLRDDRQQPLVALVRSELRQLGQPLHHSSGKRLMLLLLRRFGQLRGS